MSLSSESPVPAPSVDARGLSFVDGGRYYRAFRGADADFFRSLLGSPGLEALFAAGLVRFRAVDRRVDGYALVVECDAVPTVTYPQEWPGVMLQRAGVAIATLGAALARQGLGLLDAHPWNVLFHHTRPVFVDLGSIAPSPKIRPGWASEFRRHIVLPLALRAFGLHGLTDLVQSEHKPRGLKSMLDGRVARLLPARFFLLARRYADPVAFYEALAEYVGGLVPREPSTLWSQYEQRDVEVDARHAFTPKQASVDALLAGLAPGTVLDIAASHGWYAELATRHGHRVVALDRDETAASNLFRRAESRGLAITPLRLDAVWPTGNHGMGLAYPDAWTRLRSDHVLVLALLHHLAAGQGVTFPFFARMMDRLAATSAIVEFIPSTDVFVKEWPLAREPWYTKEGLVEAMRPYFPFVDEFPSSPEPRLVLHFHRKRGPARAD